MSAGTARPAVFFFSDIEGSTRLWEAFPEAMKTNIARHDAIVDGGIETHGGRVVDHAGDGVFAVFEGGSPLHSAVEIQRRLQAENWEEIEELRVRIGLHAGDLPDDAEDPRGPPVNRAARVMDAGHGGQILVTPEVLELCELPQGAEIHDLGSHELKDLADPQPIRQLTHPSLATQAFPELRSLSARPNNLPTQTTPFIGRERELEELQELARDASIRVVTLTGPGGLGKTRTAVQAAAELLDAYPDGVFFVSLAPLDSPSAIASAVAEAIRLPPASGQELEDQLLDYLAPKSVLLVLDNFEHVIQGAPFVSRLLANCPSVQILTTSRARLNLKGEVVYTLGPLQVPPPQLAGEDPDRYSAVRLFLDVAQRSAPGLSLAEEAERDAIARICRLVDGMPLAIEMAAAWTRLLPPSEVVEEIESSLDALETRMPDVPSRQQSVRAVFEYSWNLLESDDRDVFMRLAVFRGGFTRQAARQVAEASLIGLSRLADQSLLARDADDRFAIHELLRRYGEEKLAQSAAEDEDVRQRHLEWALALAEEASSQMAGPNKQSALDRLDAEHDNLRAALAWAVETDRIEAACRLALALGEFWEVRAHLREGLQRLTDAVAIARDRGLEASLRGRLLVRGAVIAGSMADFDGAERFLVEALEVGREHELDELTRAAHHYLGQIAHYRGDLEQAEQRYRDSLAGEDDAPQDELFAKSINNLGVLYIQRRQYEDAEQLLEQSLSIRRNIGDKHSIAKSINNLGLVADHQGDFDLAAQRYRESLELFRQVGDKVEETNTLNNLAEIAREQGRYAQAERIYEENLELERELGRRQGIARSLANLGLIALHGSDVETAEVRYLESLRIRSEIGDKPGTAVCLVGLAAVRHQRGDRTRSAELLGTVDRLLEMTGVPPDKDAERMFHETTEALERTLEREDYKAARKRGYERDTAEALQLAGMS